MNYNKYSRDIFVHNISRVRPLSICSERKYIVFALESRLSHRNFFIEAIGSRIIIVVAVSGIVLSSGISDGEYIFRDGKQLSHSTVNYCGFFQSDSTTSVVVTCTITK